MYEYRAPIAGVRVIDGDTLELTLDLGFHVSLRQTIRLAAINAPELRTDPGKAARDYVLDWLRDVDMLTVHTIRDHRTDKYGRFLGIVYRPLDGLSLNDALLADGHAVPYL